MYAVKAAVEAANGSTSGADLAAVMPTITVEGVTGTMTWNADGNTNQGRQRHPLQERRGHPVRSGQRQ